MGFMHHYPEGGGCNYHMAVRHGSRIHRANASLAEGFVEITQKIPTVAEYAKWESVPIDGAKRLLDKMVQDKLIIVGLASVKRNPLMFKFLPVGETAYGYGDGDFTLLNRKYDELSVSRDTFQFWIESYDASSVHDAIERTAQFFDSSFEEVKASVMNDLEIMLASEYGRLEYLNLGDSIGKWEFTL